MNKFKILVVEDDDEIREVVVDYLQMEGHDVVGAVNGREALEKIESWGVPGLIFLDLNMPIMAGQEFLDLIKDNMNYVQIPVVVMTAVPDSKVTNVVAVLTKPVDIDDLASFATKFAQKALLETT